MTNILVRLFIVFMWVLTPFVSYAEDKLIEVPSEIMIEMVLADESGFLDGSYDLRFRLFDESTYERLWYEDIYAVDIEEGAFVVTLNSDESFLRSKDKTL